jgi:hypothetical protein
LLHWAVTADVKNAPSKSIRVSTLKVMAAFSYKLAQTGDHPIKYFFTIKLTFIQNILYDLEGAGGGGGYKLKF